MTFTDLKMFSRHIEVEHVPLCSTCNIRFKSQDALANHIKTDHMREVNYHCTVCNFTSTVKQDLKEHINSQHESCCTCECVCADKEKLKEHLIQSEHGYKCDKCTSRENSQVLITGHMDNTHSNTNSNESEENFANAANQDAITTKIDNKGVSLSLIHI